ncbi:MAG: hypothetical protein AB7L76_25665 [Burkholderiaceae bacterium]
MELAAEVCAFVARRGIAAPAILEPSCGRGAFLAAAAHAFGKHRTLLGFDINPEYVAAARRATPARVDQGDFFATDWQRVLDTDPGPWLILGNPPWVTNAELETLDSTNLPAKSNFQGHRGLDAITGKANFDISEWMLLQQLSWLKQRSGWIAMLMKTSVARKILRQAWKRREPVGRAALVRIDALRHFGAAVDACLFVLPVKVGETSQDCDVYPALDATAPVATLGFHDGVLITDGDAYAALRDLTGTNTHYVWRSGVKHDCAKLMELSRSSGDALVNGNGELVTLEDTYVFPMLKSSDVVKGRTRTDRFMIVTQRRIGQDTSTIQAAAPRTWDYLLSHAAPLDRRSSVIYRKKPRFSVFGVGDYTFAPWKVAVSGFYKEVRFLKVGPVDGKPAVFDDTVYFLPCGSEQEADFILGLLRSEPYRRLLASMIFADEKRPITAELLKRISLERVAARLGMADEYRRYAACAALGRPRLVQAV